MIKRGKPGVLWVNLLLLIFISACTNSGFSPNASPSLTPSPTPPPLLKAEVIFQVEVPKLTGNKQNISIDILDEVTGLALNPSHYTLEQVDTYRYATRISIPIGSIVKYRYGRDDAVSMIEFTPNGKQVRFRLLKVTGPMLADDIVSAWTDTPFKGLFGRISGQVREVGTNLALPNLLITACGAQTFTASDGTYLLEGLPPGTHRLTAYDLDGAHEVYQQGALVAADTVTPASFQLIKAPTVKVTFTVHAPIGSVRGIPMRIIGNIYSLGNTFSDLGGGLSTIASRSPILSLQSDNSYSITLVLPVGFDLRYKYSLGDGFWNSEHTQSGGFYVRQLIIPNRDIRIEDSIETWQTPNVAPVTFTVKVPGNTPISDSISIQFDPYGWTEPIPIWPLGNNQWMYVLYSPLSIVGSVGYRYCRNDQCGAADDEATKGANSHGLTFTPTRLPQSLQDEVKKWAWWQPVNTPTTIVAPEIFSRGSNFIAGIEFQSNFQPSWQPQWNSAFLNIKELGANWLFFTPTWTFTRQNPPVLEVQPGKDPQWNDLKQMASWAAEMKLKFALFPTTNIAPNNWWTGATRDNGWWQSWFDRYQAFLNHFADLAAQTNASALIIGENNLLPAITGLLPSGSPSGLPADAPQRWSKIISGLRTRYKGPIYWSLPFTGTVSQLPSFVDEADGIYILWSAPLNVNQNAKEGDFVTEIARYMDQELIKMKEKSKKPMLVGIQFGSFDGAAKGCITIAASCQTIEILSQPAEDIPSAQVDLLEQVNLYNAFLIAVNQRKWIDGFISRGYYPPAMLQDKSASIHGKPAGDAVWYWFPKFIANPN